MKKWKMALAAGSIAALFSLAALAAGLYTNNLPYLIANPLYQAFTTQAPVLPNVGAYTGNEGIGVDTNLPGGSSPQTAAISLFNLLNGTVLSPANTTSFTATVAQVCGGGKQTVVLTPTAALALTMPTAALCIANLPSGVGTPAIATPPQGYTWILKVVDAATVASTFAITMTGASGFTFVGPVIVQPATSNEYLCAASSATAVVCTFNGSGA